jgi:hypothetical protein
MSTALHTFGRLCGPHPFRFFSAALFAVTLLAAVPPAQAQQQPSPAAVTAAKELIDLKGASHMFDNLVPGVIETAKNALLPTNPGLSKDLNEVAAQLRQEWATKQAEVSSLMAQVYAQHFTESEIKQALAFYKSPLGKKLIQEEPLIMEQSMAQVQSWGERFQEQVMARIRADMRKRGHNM